MAASSISKAAFPRLYLGTMTFGWSQASSFVNTTIGAGTFFVCIWRSLLTFLKCLEMLELFVNGGGVHVDTARIYAGGAGEHEVAKSLECARLPSPSPCLLGTKAHPSQGGLSKESMQKQLDTSLAALGVSQMEEYYLHQPDPDVSLLESLEFAHSLVVKGTIKVIGMSNYHADEMARCFELCEEHGLTKPSVYQVLLLSDVVCV